MNVKQKRAAIYIGVLAIVCIVVGAAYIVVNPKVVSNISGNVSAGSSGDVAVKNFANGESGGEVISSGEKDGVAEAGVVSNKSVQPSNKQVQDYEPDPEEQSAESIGKVKE